MGSFSRDESAGCSFLRSPRQNILSRNTLFTRCAIEFDRPPPFAATLVGDLHPKRLFAGGRTPAQVFASLFRRNPSGQATDNPFTRAWLERYIDSHQDGARIPGAGDSVRLHLPKRQHLCASGRTSRAVGSRCWRRNNLGGANESYARLRDLAFARLTLAFTLCNFRRGRARRFGGA